MRKWLARLSFSFFIVAVWLAWEGYRAVTGRVVGLSDTRVTLYFLAAAMAFSLGAMGVRERHRS